MKRTTLVPIITLSSEYTGRHFHSQAAHHWAGNGQLLPYFSPRGGNQCKKSLHFSVNFYENIQPSDGIVIIYAFKLVILLKLLCLL